MAFSRVSILLLIVGLFFSAQSQAEVLELLNSKYKGGLTSYVEQTKLRYQDEYKDTIEFQVSKNYTFLSNAKRIAYYSWRELFSSVVSVKDPFPCGTRLDGVMYEKELLSKGSESEYLISGQGDVMLDTCFGMAAQADWHYRLKVYFNSETNKGKMTFYFYDR